MNKIAFLLLAFFMLFSGADAFAAKAKARKGNPTKEAGRIFEKGLKAQKAGDLLLAKKHFTKVEKNYPKTPLNDEHESDVGSYGPQGVETYGQYAAFVLKFLNREIKEGDARSFKTVEDAVQNLVKGLKTENKSELEKLLWVEVEIKTCEAHVTELPPEDATELLLTKIKGQGSSLKTTEKPGSDPALILEVAKNNHIRLGLSRRGDGWIWNEMVQCAEKTNF